MTLMTRPRRLAPRWFLLGTAISTLVVGAIIASSEYPVLSLLPGGPWLLADAGCPASIRALHDVRDTPSLRASVLIVPAEIEVAPVRDLACELMNQQLTERGHWLRLLPDSLTCTLVANEAVGFRAEKFVASPAWAYNMVPLPANAKISDLLAISQGRP